MEIDWHNVFEKQGKLEPSDESFKKHSEFIRQNDLYSKYLKRKARILDVGIGPGLSAIPLAQFGYTVSGIDNDKRILEHTKKNIKRFGVKIKLAYGDAFNLSKAFAKDSFDCCIHDGLMEHFSDKDIPAFVKEQLKIAPLVICSVPLEGKKDFKVDIYRNMKTEEGWRELLRDFNVVETRKVESQRFKQQLFLVIKRKI
jgi:2-polyprenyl-3-methyl-5-hydroxy-6-metoxy-1,4-benzoquinol methylase